MILLRRRIAHLLHSTSRAATLFFSSASQNPLSNSPFIVEYLISSVGLSQEAAIKASKNITHLKSPSQPDSVIQLLKQSGFSDDQIKRLVVRKPNILCASVDKKLRPKMKAMMQTGFTESELTQLLSEIPSFFHSNNAVSRIQFWRDFFGNEDNFLKTLIRGRFLLTSSLDNRILPNISFLSGCGIPVKRIGSLIKSNPRLITAKLGSIKDLVARTEELGFCRGSGMFYHALDSVFKVSLDNMKEKIKLLRSAGWSESEVSSVILRAPYILKISNKNLADKRKFFLERLGCDMSYLAKNPTLLSLSLDKRLVPRCDVLQLLKSKGLLKRKVAANSVMQATNETFILKFILPYREKIPKLLDNYVAATAVKL
ncbi:hypothetical protein HPP92_018576 [Vanilla planifolia]|uniref:Uncharacterized protein n=1 Tax=Vanilla planifolia TaxID=51239 RepID=A0A835QID2_VANPL|nr:hypothetical protein HPP92_018576 [Vanilla planifolia]